MLVLPTKGVARSIQEHKVDLDVLCDWIEGTILFDEKKLSTIDIVDSLCEGLIYDDQSFATARVQDAWCELRRRQSCIGHGSAFLIDGSQIKRTREWRSAPAHSFCVILSFAKWYPKWTEQFGSDYNEQGELFEELTKESLQRQFGGWNVHKTGWSRSHPKKLNDVIDEITDKLGELKGNPETWGDPQANEAGVDLLCYRPFTDNRVGTPVFLMQCASGLNWAEKLKTPDITDWRKYIQFAARPSKAFATPFALIDGDFLRCCGKVDGMLLDRTRILAATNIDDNWVSNGLRQRLIRWMRPRISKLPRAKQ